MTSRDARGGARNRVAALTAAAVALIVAPVVLGFRLAAAEGVTPRSGTQQPVVIVTTPGPGLGTLPEVVDAGTGQEPVTIEDALTPRPDEVVESRITWLRTDGLGIPVPNGGPIDLGNGAEVTVTVHPYPPINFDPAGVDFVVTRNGAPIPGATMTISYDMRFMAHGPFPLQAAASQAGTFTSEYHFFMFGPWQIDAIVTAPGLDPIPFSISIYVWPTT